MPAAGYRYPRNVPTYDYRCNDCGETFEIWQSFSEDALTECPTCEGELKKVYSKVGMRSRATASTRTTTAPAARDRRVRRPPRQSRPVRRRVPTPRRTPQAKLLELRLLVEFQQLRRLISTQRRRSLPLEIPSPGVDHRAPERPTSPLSSATVAIGAVRYLLRRYRVGPVLVILAAAILVIGAMRHAETTTASALSRWQATVEVWTTTGPVDAGETIEPGAVRPILVPADLVPVGAVATDPRGLRTASNSAPAKSSSIAGSPTPGRRSPPHAGGWRTISIGRRDDLFAVGDLVDLHHAVDGRRIAADALVVMASDADLGVAVPADVVGDVVRASGQAGVVPVLSG